MWLKYIFVLDFSGYSCEFVSGYWMRKFADDNDIFMYFLPLVIVNTLLVQGLSLILIYSITLSSPWLLSQYVFQGDSCARLVAP